MKPGKLLHLVSRVVPVRLKKVRTSKRKSLELYLHKKQFRLQYGKVLYSDGHDYFPFKIGLSQLSNHLPAYDNVLVLGAGIGSIGMILQEQFPGKRWQIDFVDISRPILDICGDVMQFYPTIDARFHCIDAMEFVATSQKKYDLVCVDIFNENIVPEKFLSQVFLHFLQQLRQQGSGMIMNIMFQTKLQRDIFESILGEAFPDFNVIEADRNCIYLDGGIQSPAS